MELAQVSLCRFVDILVRILEERSRQVSRGEKLRVWRGVVELSKALERSARRTVQLRDTLLTLTQTHNTPFLLLDAIRTC